MLKGSETEEVTAAIHTVHMGRTYIGSTMATILLKQSSDGSGSGLGLDISALTPTEKKILRLIADGLSSKEIGDELSIHYRTVENHRTNMCRKLNIEGGLMLWPGSHCSIALRCTNVCTNRRSIHICLH